MTFPLTPPNQYPESSLPEYGVWTTDQLTHEIIARQASVADDPEAQKAAARQTRQEYAKQFSGFILRHHFPPEV